MAEENQNKYETTESSEVEIKDRGVFDFLGKKKEEPEHEEVILTEFEKVKVSDEPEKKEAVENKHNLLEEIHRSKDSSSSSSDEEVEVGEGGEKKKKKKGLKEKIKEKIEGDDVKHENTSVPVEKVEVVDAAEHNEEKKGFVEKIKEKLPGQKKTEEVATPHLPPPVSSEYGESATTADVAHHEGEAKEKKGIIEKIKEKLPGYHPKTEEDKEKESAAH